MSLVNKDAVVRLIKARKPCTSDASAKFEAKFITSHAEIEIHRSTSKLCKNCKECVNNGKSINR